MFEFATRWLVCLVLLAVVVQSERTIKNMANSLFEERQAMLVWMFVNVCHIKINWSLPHKMVSVFSIRQQGLVSNSSKRQKKGEALAW